jgi:hypothetical protein
VKGVEDALRRLGGVGSIQVDLQSNRVVLVPERDVELDLAVIPRAIRRAGFTPADMVIVARGMFRSENGESVFRIDGWQHDLRVRAEGTLPDEVTRLRASVDFAGDEAVLVPLRE